MGKSLLLVDFGAVFWRVWHATADRELSAAHDGTVRAIRAEASRYDHTAVCLDSPVSWRRERFPAYKATREAKPKNALDQMRRTIDTLRRDGLRLFEASGFEGDDVIATFVRWAAEAMHVTIFGCDKDLYQLLGPSVEMLNNATGVVIGVDELYAKRGIRPDQVPCFLALLGDTSDNLPGVARCGEKTAAKLLQRFQNIEGILCGLDEGAADFTPALGRALDEARGTVFQVRELCRLRDDVPIDCGALLRPAEPTQAEEEESMSGPGFDEERAAIESEPPPPRASGPTAAKGSNPELPATEPPPAHAPAEVVDMTSGNGKALAPVPASWSTALEPVDINMAWKLSKAVVASRMFAAYGRPEAVLLVLMAGREYGLGAMASLRGFHVGDNGKPSMSAQLMMALCLSRRDLCRMFRVARKECDDTKAVVYVQRPEWPEPERWEWTIEDAEQAQLTNKPTYRKHPRDMLINRCIAEAARFTWPELMANVYLPEEMESAA